MPAPGRKKNGNYSTGIKIAVLHYDHLKPVYLSVTINGVLAIPLAKL